MRALFALPLAAVGLALASGCTANTGHDPEPDVAFAREDLLENVADNVLMSSMRDFAVRADELVAATASLVDALEASPTGAAAEQAASEEAYRGAMAAWQRVEAMPLGPIAPPDPLANPDGLGLRDEIYSWPLANPCVVDQAIVSEAYADAGFPTGQLLPTYGLDALEYLLFHTSPENGCAAAAAINQDGSWAALGDQIPIRRARYARALALTVAARADELLEAWEREGGYRGKLVLDDTSLFVDAGAAVDAIFASLFYLDTNVKDQKLALPAGIHVDCASATCPDKVELRHSKLGAAALTQNLEVARDAFTGRDGPGFDDYLVAVDAADLATSMAEKLDAALAAVAAIPGGDLEGALSSDLATVEAAHAAVQSFVTDFKTQFMATLSLNPPNQGPVDND